MTETDATTSPHRSLIKKRNCFKAINFYPLETRRIERNEFKKYQSSLLKNINHRNERVPIVVTDCIYCVL